MKSMNLLLAAIFTFTLCLSAIPGDIFAKETKEVSSAVDKTATKSKKKAKGDIAKDININTADKELLVQLPGVGPKTADAIVKYRNKNGEFSSINDLTGVKGIGDKTLAKLKPYLLKI
jgi:comEA protein